eukprot:TRINITY_DN237_c0_g2_i2.p1 TRINITY_DN237_c0_g2~~TRINITY_DN237_c0_g2_i2.p1  ORF type:complete len:157 (+),score=24.59 TRINITY_DN237_c0_g2_i2:57-527(+)
MSDIREVALSETDPHDLSHFDEKKLRKKPGQCKTRYAKEQRHAGHEEVPAPKQRAAAAAAAEDQETPPFAPSYRCLGCSDILGALRYEAHHDKRTHVYRILEDLEPTRQAVLVTLLDTTVLRDQPAPPAPAEHAPVSESGPPDQDYVQTIGADLGP